MRTSILRWTRRHSGNWPCHWIAETSRSARWRPSRPSGHADRPLSRDQGMGEAIRAFEAEFGKPVIGLLPRRGSP